MKNNVDEAMHKHIVEKEGEEDIHDELMDNYLKEEETKTLTSNITVIN